MDCIIELAGYSNYAGLEHRLRCLGFDNDTSPTAPVCRWLYEGIKVDVMPTEGTILGFTNRWYKPGMAHPKKEKVVRSECYASLRRSHWDTN